LVTLGQFHQVYYKQLFTNKHCNYLQSILEQRVFTKLIKMPSEKAWVERHVGLLTGGGWSASGLSDLQGCQMRTESVSKKSKNL
jgi:hypothetical protein